MLQDKDKNFLIRMLYKDLSKGVARILHWGPQKLNAKCARMEVPNGPRGWNWGEAVPLPNRLGGLGVS